MSERKKRWTYVIGKTRMTDTNTDLDKYLNFSQAANLLKCGSTKLYGLAQSGKIPAIKFGNRWLFDTAEVEKYLKKRTNIVKLS